jgi:hypothetical protein
VVSTYCYFAQGCADVTGSSVRASVVAVVDVELNDELEGGGRPFWPYSLQKASLDIIFDLAVT